MFERGKRIRTCFFEKILKRNQKNIKIGNAIRKDHF